MSNFRSAPLMKMRGRAMIAAAFMVLLGPANPAWPQQSSPPAQTGPTQQQPAPPPAPAPPPERSNPGLIEEVGKLLKDSASGLSATIPTLPTPGQAFDGLNSSAKDASDNLKRIAPPLSGQTMASGRIQCPAAANGAPDCKIAADQLCKSKGYADGRSLDIETSQKCSAKAYFSGRGACQTENFVTRAVCQ
jgi:hypothetical protein